jgi:hypothetical protein
MIIWSGWGILTAVFAVIGMVVGGMVGAVAGSLLGGIVGGGLAAFLNHLVAKPTVLTDPQSLQQVKLKKSNSLFFIPMTWFTPVLVVGGIVIGVAGMATGTHGKEMDAKYPGKKVFEQANERIDSLKGGPSVHGNTPEAEKAAEAFQSAFGMIHNMSFDVGSKTLPAKEKFLTYCHRDSGEIVFLCHVPKISSYKDAEAKDGLAKIAWQAAIIATKEFPGVAGEMPMIVGLRGFSSYQTVLKGTVGSEPTNLEKGEVAFYVAFAEEAKAG